MPNTIGRAVPLGGDYRPRGLLPDGLLPVSRPEGSYETTVAAAANRVADVAGAIADDAAKHEGKAAGKVAGLDPHFRPDGSMTLRGRAYNEAATQTYGNQLEAKMRTQMQTVFEANKNDPKALKAGLDKLHVDLSTNDVFDYIRGDFDAQFARLRMPYENKALNNLEEREHANSRASIIENTSATETNAARMAAADPSNPATAANIEIELQRHGKLIDDAVAREDITADAGAKLKLKTRDSVLTSAALAQASALKTPEAVAAYRANARAKFAKGEFTGLSGDGYASLDAGLRELENTVRTRDNTGVAQLGKNLNDFVDRAASGLPTPPEEWMGYVTSDAAKTPQGALVLKSAENKVKLATVMSSLSVQDAGQLVAGLRAEAAKGGATRPDGDVIAFAEAQLEKQRKALNTDQLGYAEQKRLIPAVAPVDFQGYAASGDAATLAAQIRDRTGQARAVGSALSRSPQFLRPEEKDRLQEIVAGGGQPALQLAGAIVKGAGTDAPAILREISTDAPLLAQAGNIIATGGSMSAARDAFEAARIKQETGKDLPGVPSTAAGRITRASFGTAFALQGEDGGRIRETADAIAKARINRANIDPASSEAETIYTRALQEAAGASFVNGEQYGGVTGYKSGWFASSRMVPVPSGIRASSFRDVLRSITDADLASLSTPPQGGDGKPYSARDLASAVPVAVRGGYRFALGDPSSGDPRFMRGADGKPFVMPFETVSKFAPRVPGALIGGN